MERIGFLYDTTRCVGCKACQIACKEQNKLGVGEFFRRVETLTEEGVLTHFSAACNHCENPACVEVCPTGAIDPADFSVSKGPCLKCGACVKLCPQKARYFDHEVYLEHTAQLEEEYARRGEVSLF